MISDPFGENLKQIPKEKSYKPYFYLRYSKSINNTLNLSKFL